MFTNCFIICAFLAAFTTRITCVEEIDISFVNEVFSNEEKPAFEKRNQLDLSGIVPLSPLDVKCMRSGDRYCSDVMMKTKNILIQAVQEDCIRCSQQEKLEAGKVLSALLTHHPVAFKHFLTNHGALKRV